MLLHKIIMGFFAISVSVLTFAESNNQMINFWQQQKKGADMFDTNPIKYSDFIAAKALGIQFIRIAPNKLLNKRNIKQLGNFLIGSVSKPHTELIKRDLAALTNMLDKADLAHEKVIITMLSLPYSRWSQHNHGVQERGIWESFNKQYQAIKFLQNLAIAIKNHPAVVGLNLLNEPSPELAKLKFKDWYTGDYQHWNKQVKGSPQDLNLFYNKAVKAIRKVAPNLVIILDSGYYAQPWAFKVLDPVDDTKVLYAFHMYEPWPFPYAKLNGVKYPGVFATGERKSSKVLWNKSEIVRFLQPVRDWQKKYHVTSNHIIVEEFGVNRHANGGALYLKDLIDTFDKYGWHWAFYAFREDEWDIMDYELGNGRVPPHYWSDLSNNKTPNYKIIKDNKLANIIKSSLIN